MIDWSCHACIEVHGKRAGLPSDQVLANAGMQMNVVLTQQTLQTHGLEVKTYVLPRRDEGPAAPQDVFSPGSCKCHVLKAVCNTVCVL